LGKLDFAYLLRLQEDSWEERTRKP